MVLFEILAAVFSMLALAARGLVRGVGAVCGGLAKGVRGARSRGGGGEPGMIRLLDVHAASIAGDVLIAIGLAGTIFFTVPAGEARGQVALYLLVTMLPFAVLAPVVGPVLDRFRHGRRYAMATTLLGRAFLAYLISENIGGLALYPAAFGVLVFSRAYGVARSAAVPRLLPGSLALSEANARASMFGTVAGAVVAPVGIAAASAGGQWPLRIATVIFLYGMVTALRLPPRADSDPPEKLPRLFRLPGQRGAKVLAGPLVVGTVTGSAILRAAYGFLTLYLAFSIRSGELATSFLGTPVRETAAIGLLVAALGVGSFLATAVGTRLRLRRPMLLQAGGIVLATLLAAVAARWYTLPLVALLCLVTAVASGLAKLAVDSVVQERTDEHTRASAFAHTETLLMLAWVAGGGLGLVPFTGSWGLVVLAGALLLGSWLAVFSAVRLRRERLRGAAEPAGVDPTTQVLTTPPPGQPSADPLSTPIPASRPDAGLATPPWTGPDAGLATPPWTGPDAGLATPPWTGPDAGLATEPEAGTGRDAGPAAEPARRTPWRWSRRQPSAPSAPGGTLGPPVAAGTAGPPAAVEPARTRVLPVLPADPDDDEDDDGAQSPGFHLYRPSSRPDGEA